MHRFTGQEPGYIYARWGNPTVTEAEEKIALLETYELGIEAKGILHASGMAAITTLLMSTLSQGDKILSHFSLYGGTDELVHRILPRFGISAVIGDLRDLNLETPANPTLQCVDLAALCALAKKYDCLVACDNTFATPYLQQPLAHGADFVIHSTTKFLNGHGTAIGGILIGKDVERMKTSIGKFFRTTGACASPFDAYLLTQGIKTLEVRMDKHCSNAEQIATFLNQHAAVARVNYTGLSSHPDHAIATKQMRHAGALLSFELKKGLQGGIDFMNKLQLCVRAVSLGTCDTLLSHPASMTHFSVPKEEKEKYGITDGLIRMHVGIETAADIIADLDQALQ